jgi:hypothetical protein
LDENADNLNPIEGIWTMNESGTWRNVYSGMTGSIPSKNAYRLAIVKDTTTTSYDFIAVVLESQYPHWMPGNEVGGGSNLQRSWWRVKPSKFILEKRMPATVENKLIAGKYHLEVK